MHRQAGNSTETNARNYLQQISGGKTPFFPKESSRLPRSTLHLWSPEDKTCYWLAEALSKEPSLFNEKPLDVFAS